MALVEKLSKIRMDRNAVHEPMTEATFSIFQTADVTSVLQIDTYGSSQIRKILDSIPSSR